MSILLQPCSADAAQRHYRDTIEARVEMDLVRDYLSGPDFDRLRLHAPGGSIRVWGLTPATDNSSVSIWNGPAPGDLAAFFRNRTVLFVGTICAKTRNARLARKLWGSQPDGQTWELIYFMDDGRETRIPMEKVTTALGYESDLVLRARRCPEHSRVRQLLWPTSRREPSDPVELVDQIATGVPKGQRFSQSPAARRAIEELAMGRAKSHFQRLGFVVRDVSANHPFDLLCMQGSEELHVEVKGTTSAGQTVILTRKRSQTHSGRTQVRPLCTV